jgi:hypothetical protein
MHLRKIYSSWHACRRSWYPSKGCSIERNRAHPTCFLAEESSTKTEGCKWELLSSIDEVKGLLSDNKAFTLHVAREVPESAGPAKRTSPGISEFSEEEKEAILSSLPELLTSRFGEIGFAPWTKTKIYLPVLVVNPFTMSQLAFEEWFEKFQKVRGALRFEF